ncbi:TetR/AcrR family transcriptional regulator [Rhodococcus sp. B50]|uniref:TetR/AcrR family transcriptional regulator n=1 Tax=Rhodococcus sp. B50 TaxID=2682847 RepID=UPI001BD59902|nr:TetR family transcriptional regulator [Rhodococcus sp. B50]MBS9375331.1 hypothetical protein [Rhodococcus sp. B50]
MQRTRHALVEQARALTAEHGLAGFTVEELCTRVGVSRRTFFNYFPTKEDAVLGTAPPELTQEEKDTFVARGRHDEDGLSPTLLGDLVELALGWCHDNDLMREQRPLHKDIVRNEPNLLARLFAIGETKERELAHLIALREKLPPDDPRPRLAVKLVMGLAFDAVDELLADDNHRPFDELLYRNIEFGRRLFGQHLDITPPTGTP